MFKHIFIILNAVSTLLATIIALSKWVQVLLTTNDPIKRRRLIRFGLLSTGLSFILIIPLYITYGDQIFNPPPVDQVEKKPIDISGSYNGYFIDKTGKRIPTYLNIYNDTFSDSIKVKIKNQYSSTLNAIYKMNDKILIIDQIGRCTVNQEKGFVIIKSEENQKIICEFTKDLMPS